MKKLFVIFLFLLVSKAVFSDPMTIENGIFKINFGSSFSNSKGLIQNNSSLGPKSEIDTYRRVGELPQSSGMHYLDRYFYFNGKLFGVELITTGYSNNSTLLRLLIKNFGQSTQESSVGHLLWYSEKLSISYFSRANKAYAYIYLRSVAKKLNLSK